MWSIFERAHTIETFLHASLVPLFKEILYFGKSLERNNIRLNWSSSRFTSFSFRLLTKSNCAYVATKLQRLQQCLWTSRNILWCSITRLFKRFVSEIDVHVCVVSMSVCVCVVNRPNGVPFVCQQQQHGSAFKLPSSLSPNHQNWNTVFTNSNSSSSTCSSMY